jgi:hypothetical protein
VDFPEPSGPSNVMKNTGKGDSPSSGLTINGKSTFFKQAKECIAKLYKCHAEQREASKNPT